MLIIFFYLIDKGFCPIHEFVGFFSADLKVKTKRVEFCALMRSPCVTGSQVKMSPICLFLKPVFMYIVLKKIFTV